MEFLLSLANIQANMEDVAHTKWSYIKRVTSTVIQGSLTQVWKKVKNNRPICQQQFNWKYSHIISRISESLCSIITRQHATYLFLPCLELYGLSWQLIQTLNNCHIKVNFFFLTYFQSLIWYDWTIWNVCEHIQGIP